MIKRLLLFIILIIGIWTFLARCVIMQNRWSDSKATRVFASKKVPLEIHDTLINKRHIHYAVSGPDSLPTLVFIHGSPGSWMNYMKFMWDTTLQKKFRIISIDRPGFGYSNFGEALHLQEQCDLILPVLQSLKTKYPMYLCGHSLGGPISIELAARDTGLFDILIIVAGSIDISQEKTETWRKIMGTKPLYWLLPGAFAPSNTELLYLKKDLIPLQEQFKKIICNVHFVHGMKDTWVPIENINYGYKMLINAKTIKSDTLFNAGHQIPWDNKEEFSKILCKLY